MVLLAHINDDNGLEYELDIIYLDHEDLGDGLMFLICIFMASFRIFLDVGAGLIFFWASSCINIGHYMLVDLLCLIQMNLSSAYNIYLYLFYIIIIFFIFKLITFDILTYLCLCFLW